MFLFKVLIISKMILSIFQPALNPSNLPFNLGTIETAGLSPTHLTTSSSSQHNLKNILCSYIRLGCQKSDGSKDTVTGNSQSAANFPKHTLAVKRPLLGIYYGNQGWDMNSVKALENWQGKKHAVVNLFTNWVYDSHLMNNLFEQQLPNIWNNQNVPMITWEPYVVGDTPNDIEVRIARGEYDDYIYAWATQLKTFLSGPDGIYGTEDDRRVYLRLAHEMNGDWYPWGATMGNNSPQDYIQMWQRTKSIFDEVGLDNSRVQWVWSVNHVDIGRHKAEAFYPGDEYVDWISIDGYNWGTTQSWSRWETPAEVFDPMLKRLHALADKPIGITELGTTTVIQSGNNVQAKSQWIAEFLDYVVNRDIRMIVWFNEDKETDWALFGGVNGDYSFQGNMKAYSSYRAGLTPLNYKTSDPQNPRLLSDKAFKGLP